MTPDASRPTCPLAPPFSISDIRTGPVVSVFVVSVFVSWDCASFFLLRISPQSRVHGTEDGTLESKAVFPTPAAHCWQSSPQPPTVCRASLPRPSSP